MSDKPGGHKPMSLAELTRCLDATRAMKKIAILTDAYLEWLAGPQVSAQAHIRTNAEKLTELRAAVAEWRRLTDG